MAFGIPPALTKQTGALSNASATAKKTGSSSFMPVTKVVLQQPKGYINPNNGQFAGAAGGNSTRKLSTLQALLSSGQTSTINKEEWAKLRELERNSNGTAVGEAVGPDGTVLGGEPAPPGSASMADALRLEQASIMRQNAINAINSNLENSMINTRGQYDTMRAKGATQYVDSTRDAGFSNGSVGNGWNPLLTERKRLQDKRAFRTYAQENENARQAAIIQLQKQAAADIAAANTAINNNVWDLLAGTRTKVNV